MEIGFTDRQILSGLYSSEEKQAIYQVLCGVRLMGKHDMELKLKVINEFIQVVNMTESDRVLSRKFSFEQIKSVLIVMDKLKKTYFAKFIANVIIAGGPTPEEEQLFNTFVNLYDLHNIYQ